MKPTMKLRWRRAHHGEKCVAFGEQWRNGFSDEWGVISGYVLQQWWVSNKVALTVYREDENGNTLLCPTKEIGEWRDIPIEVEE